jgi:hypothetical protein
MERLKCSVVSCFNATQGRGGDQRQRRRPKAEAETKGIGLNSLRYLTYAQFRLRNRKERIKRKQNRLGKFFALFDLHRDPVYATLGKPSG